MEGRINIINTDVVLSRHDVFWKDLFPENETVEPREVLVLIRSENYGQAEQEVLNKLLAGCKLEPAQYHIYKVNVPEIAWYSIIDHFKPRIVISFGFGPVQLGIAALIAINQVNHFGGCLWVPALSIADMTNFPEQKKVLWEQALRPLFIEKKYS